MFEWKLLFQLPTSLIFLNCQKYIFFRIQILILWASNASNLILYIFLMYFLSLYNRNLSNSILISSLYDYTTFSTLNYYFLISHFVLYCNLKGKNEIAVTNFGMCQHQGYSDFVQTIAIFWRWKPQCPLHPLQIVPTKKEKWRPLNNSKQLN